MKKSVLLSLVFTFLFSSVLSAQYFRRPLPQKCWNSGQFYVGGTGSLSYHTDHEFCLPGLTTTRDYKIGAGGSVQLGYILHCFRFEVEGLVKYNDLDCIELVSDPAEPTDSTFDADGFTRDIALMFNAYVHLPFCKNIGYYLGAGFGASKNKIEFDCFDGQVLPPPTTNKSTLFAWQVLTGFTLQCFKCLELSIGYRLFSTEKVCSEVGISSSDLPFIHNAEVGIKFKF